jgi:hypothetical protein
MTILSMLVQKSAPSHTQLCCAATAHSPYTPPVGGSFLLQGCSQKSINASQRPSLCSALSRALHKPRSDPHQVHDALGVDVCQSTGHLVGSQRHAAQVCAAVCRLAAGAEPALDHSILQASCACTVSRTCCRVRASDNLHCSLQAYICSCTAQTENC